jgi:hypothetical protein
VGLRGEATRALAKMVEGKEVRCTMVDYDSKDNRPVARCFVREMDLQRELVKRGLVWGIESLRTARGRRGRGEAERRGHLAGAHDAAVGVAGTQRLDQEVRRGARLELEPEAETGEPRVQARFELIADGARDN